MQWHNIYNNVPSLNNIRARKNIHCTGRARFVSDTNRPARGQMMLDILHRHVVRNMDGFPRISNCEYFCIIYDSDIFTTVLVIVGWAVEGESACFLFFISKKVLTFRYTFVFEYLPVWCVPYIRFFHSITHEVWFDDWRQVVKKNDGIYTFGYLDISGIIADIEIVLIRTLLHRSIRIRISGAH